MLIAKRMDEMKQEREVSGEDSELVMISALEHYSYCPRQCALIHVEQTYDENLYTMRGKYAHERVDKVGGEVRKGVAVRRGLSLWSRRYQLTGKADAVEFHDRVGPAQSVSDLAASRNQG